MTNFTFQPARKVVSNARIALYGKSSSGKTRTGIRLGCRLAQVLPNGRNGKCAVVDTEHQSSALYARYHQFDVCCLGLDPNDKTPYHPSRYLAAVDVAVRAGYSAIVIDSISHAWKAVLEHVDTLAAKNKGNSFKSWGGKDGGTALQDQFIEALLSLPCHLIVTMRSKAEYVVETGLDGKSKPRKIGLAPTQRDSLDYEFRVVGSMDNAVMTLEKSSGFSEDGRMIEKPDEAFADELASWLADGEQVEQTVWRAPVVAPPASVDYIGEIFGLAQAMSLTPEQFHGSLFHYYGTTNIYELNSQALADCRQRMLTAVNAQSTQVYQTA